jgi:hypothetical protein
LKRRLSLVFWIVVVIVVLGGVAAVYVRFYLAPRLAKHGLERVILSDLGETATVDRVSIRWFGRPGIEYQGLTVQKRGEQAAWLKIDRLVLRVNLRSLLSQSIQWKTLTVEHPVVRVSGEGGHVSSEFLGSISSRFDRLHIRNGEIRWPGREVRALFASFRPLSKTKFSLDLKGALRVGEGVPGSISVKGVMDTLSERGDWRGARLSAEIEAEGVDPLWFEGGFVPDLPTTVIGRKFTLMAKLNGDLGGRFEASGSVGMSGALIEGEGSRVDADFVLSWDGEELRFEKVRLKAPHVPLEGRGRVYRVKGSQPWVALEVSSPWFLIARGGDMRPFLPEKIDSFLGSVEQGDVRLVSLRFTGPLRDLGFLEKEEPLGYWRGEARFRDVVIPWNKERVTLKSGSVRLDHDRLVGEIVKLTLGGSELEIPRLTLGRLFGEQSIDLMVTGRLSLADIPKWLSSGLLPQTVAPALSHIHITSGSGDVNLQVEGSLGKKTFPVFSGRLVVTGASVRTQHLPGSFKSVAGIIDFSPKGLVFRDIQGRWRTSLVKANGSITALSSEHPEVDLSIMGRLDLGELSELASWEGFSPDTYRVLQEIVSPAGEADYTVSVKGPLGLSEKMEVRGELSVRNGSSRLWGAYPVQGVHGSIVLSRQGVSIPRLQGQWRNSDLALEMSLVQLGGTVLRNLTFSGTFDIRDIAAERFEYGLPKMWRRYVGPFDFQNGKARLEVTHRERGDRDTLEGDIYFQDATIRYTPVFPRLTNVNGTVSFNEAGLETIDVQGRRDPSLLKIKAHLIREPENSRPTLSIHADEIDWEEIFS